MSILQAINLSRAPIAALAAVGCLWGGFAAYIPDIKAKTGASDAELGVALMAMAIGSIITMSLGPRFYATLGRHTLPAASLALSLAILLPLLAKDAATLGLAFFGMGATIAFLDLGANLRISTLENRHGLHLMNVNHAMFSFGFAAMAFVASIARKAGWPPEAFFPLIFVVVLALGLAMIERRGWQGAPPAPEGADHKGIWAAILPVALILFIAFVTENGSDSWSALHIERTLGGVAGAGGLGPAVFGLMMGFGRLFGQLVAQRLGEAALIFWSAVVGVIGGLITAVAPTPAVAIFGLAMIGLGIAVTVPSANSILGKLVRPDQRSYAISRAWMIGFTGFVVGPTTMGFISEHFGLRAAFVFLALAMALILPAISLTKRRST
ncbi:MAG: MFS transporter [Albidovulum sp.]